MRIAYRLNWKGGVESGVYWKIVDQVNAWRKLGHETRLFVGVSKARESAWLNSRQLSGLVETQPLRYYPLSDLRLESALRAWQPDIVYRRSSARHLLPQALRAMSLAPCVTELNGNETVAAPGPSRITSWSTSLSFAARTRSSSGLILTAQGLADGLLARGVNRPYLTLGNGIDISRVPKLPTPKQQRLGILFSATSPEPAGFSEILSFARHCPDIDFHLVGPFSITSAPANCLFHGSLSGAEYFEIAALSHAGLGPPRIDLKGLKDASPLKVREYLAMGLPVILPYRDIDIRPTDNFALTLGTTGALLSQNTSSILDFVEKWRLRRVPREEIVHLDVSHKEPKRLEFLKSFVDERAKR